MLKKRDTLNIIFQERYFLKDVIVPQCSFTHLILATPKHAIFPEYSESQVRFQVNLWRASLFIVCWINPFPVQFRVDGKMFPHILKQQQRNTHTLKEPSQTNQEHLWVYLNFYEWLRLNSLWHSLGCFRENSFLREFKQIEWPKNAYFTIEVLMCLIFIHT